MTKSTITRERLQEMLEWCEVFRRRPRLDDIAEAIRIALAAMDSEPVAYIDKQWTLVYYVPPMSMGLKIGDKLYRHAQPVPVVSADLLHTAASAIEDLLTTKDRTGACVWFDLPFRLRSAANAQPAPVVPDEKDKTVDADDHPLLWSFNEGWNACRAAMLAAANCSIPMISDKWIPVSERLPESNGMYFGWDGKRVLEVYCFFGGFSANQFIHGEITHWMPLPAAPQEVK